MNAKKVLESIGWYYLEENDYDDAIAVTKIQNLGIVRLTITGSTINIELLRPGLLIGHHGDNITKLTNYLSQKLNVPIKIHIIENTLISNLYNFTYALGDKNVK